MQLKMIGLMVFMVTTFVGAQQSDNDRCVQGQCGGFRAPSGRCTTPLLYQDQSQTPVALSACVTGNWVPVGGTGGGGSYVNNNGSGYLCFSTTGTSCTNVVTADQIAPGFSITSFTGGSTVELGATVTNPTFSASYSSAPTSAQITNTDGINSPFALSSPFTSATISGSFTHAIAFTNTFTLSAVGSTTKTANQAIQWLPRFFGGVGTAGATGATASGTTAVLTGATGTLPSLGLSAGQTGTFSVNPSGQAIYYIGTGSHTFTVNTFATTFTCTAITFVNANSVTVTGENLCVSPTTYTGAYTVVVN